MATESTTVATTNPKVPFLRYSILRDEINALNLALYILFPMLIYKTIPEVGDPPLIYEDDWWQKDDASLYMTASDINAVHAEGISFFNSIKAKRVKWNELVKSGRDMRPTCHIISQGFMSLASTCQYQYGVSPFIDAICIGFLWAIIWGMLTLVIRMVLILIFFPVGYIYDVISCRRKAQSTWFHRKVKEEGYAECGSIESENKLLLEYETYGKALAEKFGADKVKTDLYRDIVVKQVLTYDSDGDYYVAHNFVRHSMVVSWIGPVPQSGETAQSTTESTKIE